MSHWVVILELLLHRCHHGDLNNGKSFVKSQLILTVGTIGGTLSSIGMISVGLRRPFILLVPKGNPNLYRSNFFKDFIDVNVGMWTSNNALVPDPERGHDILTSQPYHWPFLWTGIRMCSWDDRVIKFYLLGNPIIWWGSTLSVIVFVLMFMTYLIRSKRQLNDFKTNGILLTYLSE
jgi:hypothetical protein